MCDNESYCVEPECRKPDCSDHVSRRAHIGVADEIRVVRRQDLRSWDILINGEHFPWSVGPDIRHSLDIDGNPRLTVDIIARRVRIDNRLAPMEVHIERLRRSAQAERPEEPEAKTA